jgi:hypothetical protein
VQGRPAGRPAASRPHLLAVTGAPCAGWLAAAGCQTTQARPLPSHAWPPQIVVGFINDKGTSVDLGRQHGFSNKGITLTLLRNGQKVPG